MNYFGKIVDVLANNKYMTEDKTKHIEEKDLKIDSRLFPKLLGEKVVLTFAENQKALSRDARKDVKELITNIWFENNRKWVLTWTKEEQKNFFNSLKRELEVGFISSEDFKRRIKNLLENEIKREEKIMENWDDLVDMIARDWAWNIIFDWFEDYNDFINNSFLVEAESKIYPYNLNLVVTEEDRVDYAMFRLEQYFNSYKALVLIDKDDKVKWIIKAEDIIKYKEHWKETLEWIPYIDWFYALYSTTSKEIESRIKIFNENNNCDINICPVIDGEKQTLIWIVTLDMIEKIKINYYSSISLNQLKVEVSKKVKVENIINKK